MATRKHRKKRPADSPGTRRTTRGRSASGTPSSAATERLWLYGTHPVHAALANQRRHIIRLLATESAAASLPSSALAPEIVDRQAVDAALPDGAVHQGLAALVAPLDQPGLKQVLANATGEAPLLVLDQVTDPHNVGAMLRSAAAFGAAAVITTERHAPPESGALAKAAAGALERLPLVRASNLARALGQIAQADFWILGLDADGARTLAEARPGARTALVLGAEGAGLRRLTRDACDEVVRLPIAYEVDSLNVSNAAAVGLYELTQNRGNGG